MNATSNVAPVITADNDALTRDFPLKPFGIRHKLSGHPLLTLPRIAQLAAELPRDRIEYNSGDAAISQDPDKVKSVDLDPVEVVKRIESAGAWMVLKRIEESPEYRALLEDALLSVARARGFKSLEDAGFSQVEGFLFVSSPNSTTPFHMDAEDNFFVQIYGEKTFAIFDNRDGFIAIKGRAKRFAKIGGEMVSLAAIESMLAELWPNALSAVANVPDARKGERLVIVTQQPDATKAAFQSFAKGKGASELMIPGELIVVPHVPVLGSGKLDFAGVNRLVAERVAAAAA